MNPVFKTNAFWIRYGVFDLDEVAENEIAAELDMLRKDFTVKSETHHHKDVSFTTHSIRMSFPCGDKYSLVLDYSPSETYTSVNLFLMDQKTLAEHPMGWQDDIRAHPHCLQESELNSLMTY